jgi:LysR family transcriptional activator of mexEF-oprN operon
MNTEFNLNELRKVDLNLLLVLSVLVREGSVRRTAMRLKLGSPAVSMSLSRLRDLLNDPLLVRSGRGMAPTPRALELVKIIDPFLETFRMALLDQDTFDPRDIKRSVRFGIVDDLETVLLPKLITTLRKEAPGVRLFVRDVDYQYIDQALLSGDADVVLAAILPDIQQREPHRLLYKDHFVALFDKRQVKVGHQLDLETYLDTPQILVSVRGDTAGMIEAPLQALGLSREILATVTRFSTLPLVLKETKALCNVPTTSAKVLSQFFDLTTRPLPITSPEFTIGLAWRRTLDTDPFTKWFVNLIADLMEEIRQKA